MSGASKRVRRNDRQRLSRRQFIGAAAAGAAAALGSGPAAAVLSAQAPQVAGASARPQADVTLVLVNGRIHTMDGRNTVARLGMSRTQTDITGTTRGRSVRKRPLLNQTATSTDKPQPLVTPSSVRVTVTKVNGSWLISKLDPLV